jgi:hypothetical protein
MNSLVTELIGSCKVGDSFTVLVTLANIAIAMNALGCLIRNRFLGERFVVVEAFQNKYYSGFKA